MADETHVKLTPEQQIRVSQKLKERGAMRPCPACGQPKMVLCENKGHINASAPYAPVTGDTKMILTVIIECQNCGYIAMHNLATLDAMDTPAPSS